MVDRIVVTDPRTGQIITTIHPTQVILDAKNSSAQIVEEDRDILVVESRGPQGERGPVGPEGRVGPAGPPGERAKSLYDIWLEQGNPDDPALFFQTVHSVGYRFVQLTPATVWYVEHPLQTGMPSVSLVDSNGEEMYGDVAYLPPHNLTISFTTPVAGEAYLT